MKYFKKEAGAQAEFYKAVKPIINQMAQMRTLKDVKNFDAIANSKNPAYKVFTSATSKTKKSTIPSLKLGDVYRDEEDIRKQVGRVFGSSIKGRMTNFAKKQS